MVRRLLEDAGVDAASVRASGAGGRITRHDAERAANARASAPGPAPGFAPGLGNGSSGSGGVASGAFQGFVAIEASYEGVERARRTDAARPPSSKAWRLTMPSSLCAPPSRPWLSSQCSTPRSQTGASRSTAIATSVWPSTSRSTSWSRWSLARQDLNLRGLARRLSELLVRARAGELAVEDLLGGTFSVVGAPSPQVLVSIPQIVEPQVAVLSVGGVTRRPVVLTDAEGSDSIAIRSSGVLGLGFDTRVVDSTTATAFLERVAALLATQDWSAEL